MTDFPLTVGSLLSGALARHADRPAVVADGRTWTFRELDEASNRLAHALCGNGVTAGTPVALMLSNSAEYVVADLAIAKLGAAKVPLNDMLSDDEATYVLRDSGAVVAIASPLQVGVATAHLARAERLEAVIAAGPAAAPRETLAWDTVLADHPATAPEADGVGTDVGLIMYTGGTTGRPKGVVHRARELAVNLLSHRIETEIRPDDQLLLSSPLPHSAGFLLQTALLAGAVTHVERRFDAAGIVEKIHQDKISYLFMVPTMIYRLLDAVRDDPRDLSALRTILYGAAPMSSERLQEGLRRFGPVFVQLYGQSEAPNFITRLTREDHLDGDGERLRSCGRPVTLAEVRIIRDTGEICVPGEVGEVTARTPYTMAGYHQLPEATARTLRNGWLHTGDIGYLDEQGYLFLLDRKNDMIISGGMNVYSSEVESALRRCTEVSQAAVVGVPHPDWGEAVVAFVVAEKGQSLDEDLLAKHCRATLSAYKRPKAFRQLESLPLTVYGKVDKKTLRASWEGWGGV